MPGPPPKDPSVRSRRNKTTTRATLSAETKVKAPTLPTGVRWNTHTRAWWRDIWASPMAAEWTDSERHELFMLAVLVNAFWDDPGNLKLAAEIRMQRQCFGLTAVDRRRLQWEIEKVEGAKKKPPPRKATKAPTKKADPRRHLSAVS